MLISDQGTLVRTRASEVPVVGRDAQGVTLIRLGDGERLVGLERIEDVESPAEDAGLVEESDGQDLAGEDNQA